MVLALTALAASVSGALGQETPHDLRTRLDSLRPLVDEARAAHEARAVERTERERSAAARSARIDTFRVGGATVLTPLDEAPRARELFEDVWREHFARLGDSPALARSVFTFQWRDERVPIYVEEQHHELAPRPWTPRSEVEDAIREVLAAAMHHDIYGSRSTPVGYWLGGNPLLPGAEDDVYRRIALTRSRASRACISGDVDACASAMGLDAWALDPGTPRGTESAQPGGQQAPVRDAQARPWDARARLGQEQARLREWIAEWYTPEERRALVETMLHTYVRGRVEEGDDCVLEASIPACDELLVTRSRMDWTPLGPEARTSLVAYALDVGGEGAWSRLTEDPEMTPVEAMEHASGASIDELLAGWHAALIAARPDAFDDLTTRSGVTLLWTLFFAALALRSTRWRLG